MKLKTTNTKKLPTMSSILVLDYF